MVQCSCKIALDADETEPSEVSQTSVFLLTLLVCALKIEESGGGPKDLNSSARANFSRAARSSHTYAYDRQNPRVTSIASCSSSQSQKATLVEITK